MTILIVLAMVISAVLIDYVIQLRQAKQTVAAVVAKPIPAASSDMFLPEGVFAVPGQLWSVLLPNGRVRLGVNRLFTSVLGGVDEISMPRIGQAVRKGQLLCSVKQNGRALRLSSPVDGEISEINQNLLSNPNHLSGEIPSSWMLTVKPRNLSREISTWKLGEEARNWIKMETNRLRDFLAPAAQPAFANLQDGGMPAPGSLKNLEEGYWNLFETEFLNQPDGEQK